jgi:hypothetical protein
VVVVVVVAVGEVVAYVVIEEGGDRGTVVELINME